MKRGVVAAGAVVGAVVVGGISQTYLWRWGLGGLGNVLGSQFSWVLLTFAVAWACARGRPRSGAAAGALTGSALIVSYYATQWLADGQHAALAQLTKTGGLAWTAASIGGGALIGVLGGLASQDPRKRPRLKAFGISTPAVIVGLGAPGWLFINADYPVGAALIAAAVLFVLAAAGLLTVCLRACGWSAGAFGILLALVTGGVALGGLFELQTSGILYLTF
jgi:hypothetical protein